MEFYVNLFAFFGISVLAVPTLMANKRKKRLARLEHVLSESNLQKRNKEIQAIADELLTHIKRKTVNWNRIDEICLYFGYLMLLGSSIARLI